MSDELMTRRLPASGRYESDIVWLDPEWASYPFLRECEMWAYRRKGSRKVYGGRTVIGYANLRADAPADYPGSFVRRMWYRATGDESARAYVRDGMGVDSPIEGVLPESIRPGVVSAPAWPELRVRPRQVVK